MRMLLLTQLFATLFMVGLIWFVQIVHYPLFASVGRSNFATYEELHQRFTTWVVAPVMLVELVTAVALVFSARLGVTTVLSWIGLALLAVIWLSTWALQVPAHAALAVAFCETEHDRLVTTNWIRTAAWTARGLVLLALTFENLR